MTEPQEPSATPSTLEQVIAEMRTIALVAGQASVEGPQDGKSLMAAAESARASRWADALADLRPSEGPETGRLSVEMLRAAWEAGARTAANYGDNVGHLLGNTGGQADRHFEKFLAALPAGPETRQTHGR